MFVDHYECRCGWNGQESELAMRDDARPDSLLCICPKCGADELKPVTLGD